MGNKKSVFFGFLLAVLVIGFFGSVDAVPEIEDWQGNISDGENITISGSGFGGHADNQPNEDYLVRAWDNLDDGYLSSSVFDTDGTGPEFWSNAVEQRTGSTNCAR